jgi:hypothetical protein
MKITALIIKEGRVCCTDKEVPEDKCVHLPREFFATDNDYEEHYKGFIECGNRYESALQQIKDNAVLIREEDQDLSRKLIYNQYDPDNCNLTWCGEKGKRVPGEVSCYNQCSKYKEIKDDTFYPVSVEVEIVTKGVCCSPIPPNINHHNDCDKCEGYSELKLARIVEEPVKLPFKEFKVKAGSVKIEKWNPVVDIQEEEPVEKKPDIKEFLLIPVYADNGEHSHYTLIESSTGIKVWSEDPEECRAQGYPVNSQVEDQEEQDLFQWLKDERNVLQNTGSLMWHKPEDQEKTLAVAKALDMTIQYIQLSGKFNNQ